MNFILRRISPLLFPRYCLSLLEKKPTILGVEVTNACNANCIFCAYQHQSRQVGVMDFGLFCSVVRNFNDGGGGMLRLTPIVGEVLLDPGIMKKLEYAFQLPNIREVMFYTNGILMERLILEKINKKKMKKIYISFGGHDINTYKEMMNVDAYERVLKNIQLLDEYRRKTSWNLEIYLSVREKEPLHFFKDTDLYKWLKSSNIRVEYINKYDTWGGKKTKEIVGKGLQVHPAKTMNEPCGIIYNGPTVMWDGRLNLCGCRNFDGVKALVPGNVCDTPLLDLWQSEATHLARELFRKGCPPKICIECRKYMPLSLYVKNKLWRDF